METHLNVILVSCTPDPETTVSAAARLCYSPVDVGEIMSRSKETDQGAFLEKLTALGHLSPIEHASFTFAIEGISRACSHQLVRHRLASYSQQSQRYVGKTEGFRYIIPPSINENPVMKERFEKTMAEIAVAYGDLADMLSQDGRKGEEAFEDARFVLPNAAETKIIMTMNARELLHFFSQRLCGRAQWEIRQMALEMLKLVKSMAPTIFRHAGPPCVREGCPEGSLSCGNMEDTRKFFANLA